MDECESKSPDPEETQIRFKSVLDMDCKEARAFFLRNESYCSQGLPPYFTFEPLLATVSSVLEEIPLRDCINGEMKPETVDGVNHVLLANKDGQYAWRPLDLIHPVLYVDLVNQLTEPANWELICQSFSKFRADPRIECLGIPVASQTQQSNQAEQVTMWCVDVEEKSLELALDYDQVVHTDVANCYGSIYTHSIPWALHTRPEAKKKSKDYTLIGNTIDRSIRMMRYGQTNGIPQGSILMDFIAEMVLGWADLKLLEKLENESFEFKILRYRDDYRIFVQNPGDGETILKHLAEVLVDLGLQINAFKTQITGDVIRASLKPDKLDWICHTPTTSRFRDRLLAIREHSLRYPNSGSVVKAMTRFLESFKNEKQHQHIMPMISITTDIAVRTPRAYPVCAAVLSELLAAVGDRKEKVSIIQRVRRRFSRIPNTGYLEIWLQRVTRPAGVEIEYDEPLCKKVVDPDAVQIWDLRWVENRKLKAAMSKQRIVDAKVLSEMKPIVPIDEVSLFAYES